MWSLKCDFLKSGGKTLEKHKKLTESGGKTSAFGQNFGRSGEAQTRGLRIPNAARYQLRYTPKYLVFLSVGYYVVVALL